MFWLNGCLGKKIQFIDSICRSPCSDCLRRSLGLSACPLSLRLSLLQIRWQGISESFARPLLFCCYKTGELWVLRAASPLPLPNTRLLQSQNEGWGPRSAQACWIQLMLMQWPGFCLCINPEWLSCTWRCVHIPNCVSGQQAAEQWQQLGWPVQHFLKELLSRGEEGGLPGSRLTDKGGCWRHKWHFRAQLSNGDLAT